MKSISTLLVALLVSVGAHAFTKDQTTEQINAEVQQRADKGESAEAIAKAASAAGVPIGTINASLTARFGATAANAAVTSALGATAFGGNAAGGGGNAAGTGGTFAGFGTSGTSVNRGSAIGGSGTKACVSNCG